MDASKLEELISDAGFETRRYSGRGMYGAECVGFDTDTPVADVANIVGYTEDESERDELVTAFQSAKTDDMGRGTIIYFPRYKYPKVQEAE